MRVVFAPLELFVDRPVVLLFVATKRALPKAHGSRGPTPFYDAVRDIPVFNGTLAAASVGVPGVATALLP